MKDNNKLLSLFKDTSARHASFVMTEIEEALHGRHYTRQRDLPRLLPVWEWEAKAPKETNDDKEIGLTVHVIMRIQSALEDDQLKVTTGYAQVDISRRLQMLSALNAERRMLEVQLNIKSMEQLTEAMPTFLVPSTTKRPTKTVEEPVQSIQ